ncbi:hypothetical protein Syun_030902 [Stephania yunnanensis]|uniref:Uncharacterized protein n=1 Tax=Stephania yunnanensis TaxID=152371 RepID=A0AAP0E2Q5_9MAGN
MRYPFDEASTVDSRGATLACSQGTDERIMEIAIIKCLVNKDSMVEVEGLNLN